MKDGYYFILELTENEHYFVEEQIRDYCESNKLSLKYYRKIKTGHIPLLREVKVVGNRQQIGKFKKFMDDEHISHSLVPSLKEYWDEKIKKFLKD